MIAALLLAASTALPPSPDAGPPPQLDREYRRLAAEAGRDADAQVRLALWCESRGLASERTRHLTRAVLLDPEHAAARGLLGMVEHQGKWMRPDQVRNVLEDDPATRARMAEYLQRRAAAPETADAQLQLAQWCRANGLVDQATAHYRAVVRIDPDREVVWKRLGYRKVAGRWLSAENVAAARFRAETMRTADRRWKPVLEKLRDQFRDADPKKRAAAAEALDAIADPTAVTPLWKAFVRDDARLQRRAAETFAQIDGRSASLALADLAVHSPFAEVRGLAADFLERRDPRDYLDPLLDLIHSPFRYKVAPIASGAGRGALLVEGEDYNLQRMYDLPENDYSRLPARIFADVIPLQVGPEAQILANGLRTVDTPSPVPYAALLAFGATNPLAIAPASPGLVQEALRRDQAIANMIIADRRRMEEARARLREDVASIERGNDGIRDVNDRVLPLARAATGRDFGSNRDAWKTWWSDQLGYAYRSSAPAEKPTFLDVVTYQPPAPVHTGSCFVAGTPVQTLTGLQPIESVRVGDMVLSQDAATGAVSYKPVLLVHHNAPAATLKLRLGSETIESTGIHRFWRPGVGWTMARDLKPGDLVRAVGGTHVVSAVEPGATVPVFNLDVAENLDFFVGRTGFLVHDFSIVQDPGRPFDAVDSPEPPAVARR